MTADVCKLRSSSELFMAVTSKAQHQLSGAIVDPRQLGLKRRRDRPPGLSVATANGLLTNFTMLVTSVCTSS